MLIFVSVVEEIKSRLDITDLIVSYVPSLKKAGRIYKGLCPFHTEKTPSFVVYPDSQTWHCFGACGAGGDIFNFVMRQEGYDFPGALKVLADRAGVLLKEPTPEQIKTDKRKQKLYDIIARTATFFHHNLLDIKKNESIRQYLAERNISSNTLQQFQLGYAPNSWDALKHYLLEKGYTEHDLLEVGLLVEKQDTQKTYDRFRHRLIIPIRNINGQVIGFGARALHKNQQPKYLNSPQNALFDKSAILYGLDMAKKEIRQTKQVVIVEGYMDVLQAYQQGGKTATLRGINTVKESLSNRLEYNLTAKGVHYENYLDVDIRIATLPLGKDPDDILRKDKAMWELLIKNALPLVDYQIQTIVAESDLSTAKGKSHALRTLVPVLRQVKDPVEQNHHLKQLAKLTKIDERVLRLELQRPSNVVVSRKSDPTSNMTKLLQEVSLEEHCLALLIGQPNILQRVNQRFFYNAIEGLTKNDFLSTAHGSLFSNIQAWVSNSHQAIDDLYQIVDMHLKPHLDRLQYLWQKQYQNMFVTQEQIEKDLFSLVVRMRVERKKKFWTN
ncbi:MAG: DNA primase [Anaerolineaceae bacterium 4572_78]|nr:MAG: DNA primase [Anaerolineaceae bacterium 4572_78]